MSNDMNKSSRGSMFDGLQIFGKTDSKFSMTKSYHGGPVSNSRPIQNSNYKFNNTTLPPPGPSNQFTSLPTSLNEDEERPPEHYPLESPQSLNTDYIHRQAYRHEPQNRSKVSAQNQPLEFNENARNHSSLPKTWSRDFHSNSPPQAATDLAPLQEVTFGKESPPPITHYSPEPENIQDKSSYFFTKAASEVECFGQDLEKSKEEHELAYNRTLDEMKLYEDSLKIVSLVSIQKLLSLQNEAKHVEDLQNRIYDLIANSLYEEAEKLQNELDAIVKNKTLSNLLQFQPPRHLVATKHHLEELNSCRKTFVESLKTFCVDLNERSTKFKSITKKIEVQCSSKIDKQQQELESAQNALDCKDKHFKIDQDYLEQQTKSLESEIKVTTDDHNLQIGYQNELLEGVQSEIRELEERLKKLRSQEKSILDEKQKLLLEKVENENLQQQKSLELKREKERTHIKTVSLDHERSNLLKRRINFDSYSLKMDTITESQNKVTESLKILKSDICEAIASNEGLIVNEVHVSVNSENSNSLTIPSSLSDIINKISKHEKMCGEISNSVFDYQRQLSKLRTDEMMARTNLENCKTLKDEAVNKKRYQEAAKIFKEEEAIESQLSDLTITITETEKKKVASQSDLDKLSATLIQLQEDGRTQQSTFDKECHAAIITNLTDTLTALDSLPDITTVSKCLLEYDICYMYSYLNIIKLRNPDLWKGSNVLPDTGTGKVELLMQKISSEIATFNADAVGLKCEIDEALKKEDFDKAEQLNKKYELLASIL